MRKANSIQRLGILGGSFDPVHEGHLQLAHSAAEQAELDEVWLMPTAIQPHKPNGPIASNDDRLTMLQLATTDRPKLAISDRELHRGGVSFTVDTLRTLAKDFPETQLFLLMGADTLHDLPLWHEPREVLQLATPLVVHRPGEPAPDFSKLADLVDADRLRAMSQQLVEMPAMEVSSSKIRRRVARGESIEGLVPAAVAEYVAEKKLYR